MHVLAVGGAGYIGSHMVKRLLQDGHEVTTLDDLSSGHREAVLGGNFVQGNLADRGMLNDLFRSTQFDGVMHFASFIQVGESMHAPGKYYRNNLAGTLNLLDAMVVNGANNLIFSSTAAIFGQPLRVPIDEAHPQSPINPYGRSKWMVEQMLGDFERAHGLRSVCLRYFNAAGADPEGMIGEWHEPETHLVPLVLQAASGRLDSVTIYGRDYDTPDGTCIRDYIHVADLTGAHMAALRHLRAGGTSEIFNCGYGRGFSVLEVIDAVKRAAGSDFDVRLAPRRPGDPAIVVAATERIRKALGWVPRHDSLDAIVRHALRWEERLSSLQQRPQGAA